MYVCMYKYLGIIFSTTRQEKIIKPLQLFAQGAHQVTTYSNRMHLDSFGQVVKFSVKNNHKHRNNEEIQNSDPSMQCQTLT